MEHSQQTEKPRMVSFKMFPEDYGKLVELAVRDVRPISYLVRVAVTQYLRRRSAKEEE